MSVTILGSTGSIGVQTIDVCRSLGLEIFALTAHKNEKRLEGQIRELKPRFAAMSDSAAAASLRLRVSDLDTQVLSGAESVAEIAADAAADTVCNAIVGIAGLRPTLAAIQRGRRIALSNKETLVCAGELVMSAASGAGAEIIPVDSEHSAILQCMGGSFTSEGVERIILTASGGPFRGMMRAQLEKVTAQDALRHPVWSMGAKITADSATLMNKGLELIEAMRLFGMPPGKIDIVVHPESVVHSMVEFCDGAVIAQMGTADMRGPIRYALSWPKRQRMGRTGRLDLISHGALHFERPDEETFGCLRLAKEAARAGGTACAVLNGANERAVEAFLSGKIRFLDIEEAVAYALETVKPAQNPLLEDIIESDERARSQVSGWIAGKAD